MQTTAATLTPDTLNLFRKLVADAPNWNGSPMFDGTKEERGNLTNLKKLGLLTTFNDDGDIWVTFTDAGVAFADRELGVSI